MAKNARITGKIVDLQVQDAPAKNMVVSIEFDDGNKKLGPWHQGFIIKTDTIITIDELITELIKRGVRRPVDPYIHLREAMEKGTTFTIDEPVILPTAAE